ncbi:MAG: hypothetical protein QGF59_12965 [Pirellulaceae bacterium]|jgi:hypothetical protein|nr:hypothetical protein [Pirellulaceae bacterium]MDP6719562.1 hypothetical protein [Pirellulaceae bacterium]
MTRRSPANRKQRTSHKHAGPSSRNRLPKSTRTASKLGKRARGTGLNNHTAYEPPEDWHAPQDVEDSADYRIVVQSAGPGYSHVVTERQIRRRLAQLPEWMLHPLHTIQLSRMTRKKRSFPCYGMQWGATLYLYPIEASLVEYFNRPPRPAEHNETRQFGGRWVQHSSSLWTLVWTETSIRNFYLNNILIHELGHLLDDRNTSYRDRERYAEWFAVEHGLRPSKRRRAARRRSGRP